MPTPGGPGPRPDLFEKLSSQSKQEKPKTSSNVKKRIEEHYKFYNYGYFGPEGVGYIHAIKFPNNQTRLIVQTSMYFYGEEAEEKIYKIWEGLQQDLEKLDLLKKTNDKASAEKHSHISKKFSHDQLIKLFDFVKSSFNLNELKELCFELGIPYEDLGENKHMELIEYFKRRGELSRFSSKVRSKRPNKPNAGFNF